MTAPTKLKNKLLRNHAPNDPVLVDWHDGKGASDGALVMRSDEDPHQCAGGLWLRFPGEAADRYFRLLNPTLGHYCSEKGQIVEISRNI